ncbi:MAG: COG4315 family predicted lipoprotein [Gaiellaceae bacterium]
MRFGRAAVVIVAGALLGALATSAGAGNQAVVKSAKNRILNETILVTTKGMTLYRLSGEKQGALSCATPACFAIWHPLWIAPGTTPTGAKHLGTLKRPDGRIQVTYKGGPLYTYVNDKKTGQVNGNGLKAGVAAWQVVVTSGTGSPAPVPSPEPGPGYGNGRYG